MAYGTALASFNVEEFGTDGVVSLDHDAVRERVDDLEAFTRFHHVAVDLAQQMPALATSSADNAEKRGDYQ
jgi:hypothetical protein